MQSANHFRPLFTLLKLQAARSGAVATYVRVMAGVTLVRGVSGLPRCLFERGYLADAGVTLVRGASGLLRCVFGRWLGDRSAIC